MTPQEFLQSKNLLDKDKTQFIIKFEDGREVDICDLLKEYANRCINDNYAVERRNHDS